MAFDIEAAKADGYTQEEIDAYLQANPQAKEESMAPGQSLDPSEPPPPPPASEFKQAGEGNFMPALGTTGTIVATAAAPLAIGIGVGKYGGRAIDAAKGLMAANPNNLPPPQWEGPPTTNAVSPQKPPMGFVDTNTPRSMGPVAPQGAPGAQMARGAAQGVQAVAPEANWMTKAVSMGNQAMSKAAPMARGVADLAARYNPALVGAQLATYSPELGPRVPQTGPYRGMEINPRTGRGWSPEELNAIANGRY